MSSSNSQTNDAMIPGLFITKGMNFSLEECTFSVNEKGEMEHKMTIHTGLDMCPYWLEIAYAHLEKTEEIHLKLIAANSGEDPNLIGKLLQEEFMSGMQTIMGACIAIDAYYASIKKFANIPNTLSQVWRKKGTARYK